MLAFVVDLDNLAEEVGEILIDAKVWDSPLEGETHGALVGVFFTTDAAVAMIATVVIDVKVGVGSVVPAGDIHIEPELEALLVTLGQQQSLGLATGAARVDLKCGAAVNSIISLLDQFLERDAVRDGHVGVMATTADVVSSGFN